MNKSVSYICIRKMLRKQTSKQWDVQRKQTTEGMLRSQWSRGTKPYKDNYQYSYTRWITTHPDMNTDKNTTWNQQYCFSADTPPSAHRLDSRSAAAEGQTDTRTPTPWGNGAPCSSKRSATSALHVMYARVEPSRVFLLSGLSFVCVCILPTRLLSDSTYQYQIIRVCGVFDGKRKFGLCRYIFFLDKPKFVMSLL